MVQPFHSLEHVLHSEEGVVVAVQDPLVGLSPCGRRAPSAGSLIASFRRLPSILQVICCDTGEATVYWGSLWGS